MSTYSGSPYYDRYDGDSQHRANGYTRVLAQPGRVEQASEFNEIQSIWRDYMGRLGNSIYKDGTIVSGCGININGTTVTVASGQVFLEGLVRNVNETELTITGSGQERIVATLSTSIVTADADESLRDPATMSENFNIVGADREKQVVTLSVVSGTSAGSGTATIYELEDGAIPNEKTATDDKYDYINDILAERTYDENGNYRVEGLNLQPAAELASDDTVKLYVSAGRAYIKGYQVTKNTMSSLNLKRSITTRLVQSESHYFNAAKMTYALSNGYIDSMENVTALITVTGEKHYRGNVRGGADSLNHTPVDSITEVYTIDTSSGDRTTFVQGRDYQLLADQVDWSLVGDDAQEPDSGTTYYVTYVYNRDMVSGTDYTIYNEDDDAFIEFLDGGVQPDHNTRFYVSYNYTLARRDLILLDSKGNYVVIEGTPDKYKDLITPYNGSNSYLELGYVNVFPKPAFGEDDPTHIAEIVNYDEARLTQENLTRMSKRVDSIEESLATLDMERDIEAGEDTMSLNGYFTDSFENLNKSDIYYDDGDIKYDACVDFDSQELTTQADISSYELKVNDTLSSGYATYGKIISAPYEYQLALKQEYATGTMKVNPYASYGPMCQVVLDPAIDNWIDEKKLVVNNTVENKVYTTTTKTYSHGYWSRNATHNLRGYLRSETKSTTTYNGTTTNNVTSTAVAKTLIEYMRQRDVAITASAFGPNSKDIYAEFNGTPVNLVATGSSVQGTSRVVNGVSYKTVNASANGYFTAKITVPAGQPCGDVAVDLVSPASGNDEGVERVGKAIYSAQGTILTYTTINTKVINQHYSVLTEVDNLYANDPLAQSFMLSTTYDRTLMKLGLYFATKSTVRPAILQIRNMVNGYPGEKVYAEVKINPEDINIPSDPNVPVVTEVVLNQPVYCYANTYYCFIVLSDSNEYSMYYAELGQNRLGTTEQLVVNPYATGVMFSSSNSTTWTAHQAADLKFELYRSYYTGNGEIVFENVTAEDVTGVMLDAAYEVRGDDTNKKNKSALTWYYRYSTGKTGTTINYSEWLPIDTLTFRELGNLTENIQLKAIITTDYSTSPYIDAGRVSLRSFTDGEKSSYITKHLTSTDFEEPYQKMKVSYLAAMPSGASHTAYYMDKEDGNWVEIKADGDNVKLSTSKADEEFVKYEWTINKLQSKIDDETSGGSTFFKFRFDIATTVRYNRPRIKKFSVIFRYE